MTEEYDAGYDEYPSEDTLKSIATYDISKNSIKTLAKFIADSWHWSEMATIDGDTLELHTGGWSGNEEIISAMRQNAMFWSVCWCKSEKGGHYLFDIKEVSK